MFLFSSFVNVLFLFILTEIFGFNLTSFANKSVLRSFMIDKAGHACLSIQQLVKYFLDYNCILLVCFVCVLQIVKTFQFQFQFLFCLYTQYILITMKNRNFDQKLSSLSLHCSFIPSGGYCSQHGGSCDMMEQREYYTFLVRAGNYLDVAKAVIHSKGQAIITQYVALTDELLLYCINLTTRHNHNTYLFFIIFCIGVSRSQSSKKPH